MKAIAPREFFGFLPARQLSRLEAYLLALTRMTELTPPVLMAATGMTRSSAIKTLYALETQIERAIDMLYYHNCDMDVPMLRRALKLGPPKFPFTCELCEETVRS